MLDPFGRGVAVRAGGVAEVRIVAAFADIEWEKYEPESFAAFARWLHERPDGLVLDVGSSIGIYSAVALAEGKNAEVVAFDPDIASLAQMRRKFVHRNPERLRMVHGFVGSTDGEDASLAETVARTSARLTTQEGLDPIRFRYLDPSGAPTEGLPCYRLDRLIAANDVGARDVLIKCDVEGAELHVLRGAERLIGRHRPAMLISVHPTMLPNYGHTNDMLGAFLEGFGYTIRCLADDHEEHWWCTAPAVKLSATGPTLRAAGVGPA
ncbi:MAG TPA: FkbM family methyltransferase [Alphaproteobacteria bacterium]|nr:FkbM family methyltransferase [Alphaproteobacteria bacterium]